MQPQNPQVRAPMSRGLDRRGLNRKGFLKLRGSALAGTALLGLARCGVGGESASGVTEFTFSFGPDGSGSLQKLVDRFNQKFRSKYKANYRVMSADTGQYFNQLKTEFQAGGGETDLIGGDVIWPIQFAVNGWIEDLSERFTQEERQTFLPAPVQSCTYDDKIYGVPWFTDAGMLYYREDLLEKSGFSEPPKTWSELKEQTRKVMQDSGMKDGFVFQARVTKAAWSTA
jgi:multiple sugar transport system substrate-binding protein